MLLSPTPVSKMFLQSLTWSDLDGFLIEFASILKYWFDRPLIFSRILPDLPARDYRIFTQISSPSKHLLAPKAMWCWTGSSSQCKSVECKGQHPLAFKLSYTTQNYLSLFTSSVSPSIKMTCKTCSCLWIHAHHWANLAQLKQIMVWLKSISSDAQYVTLQKYFSRPSLVIYFSPTPPIKL
jgi:hypothetical protein